MVQANEFSLMEDKIVTLETESCHRWCQLCRYSQHSQCTIPVPLVTTNLTLSPFPIFSEATWATDITGIDNIGPVYMVYGLGLPYIPSLTAYSQRGLNAKPFMFYSTVLYKESKLGNRQYSRPHRESRGFHQAMEYTLLHCQRFVVTDWTQSCHHHGQ